MLDIPEIVKEIETLRCKFSVIWNEFLDSSGAIVIQNPSIKSGLNCCLLTLSAVLNYPLLNTIKITPKSPFIDFAEEKKFYLSKDVKPYLENIAKYLDFFEELRPEAEKLYDSYNVKYQNAILQLQDYKLENIPPDDRHKVSVKLTQVQESLHSSLELITFMKNIMSKRDSDIESLIMDMENPSFLQNLLNICNENEKTNNGLDSAKICWKYSQEKKLNSLSEVRMRQVENKTNRFQIEGLASNRK
jgi:hypothetical protein